MENLTILLEQLAEKLGTTTEYLWGVLIRQAPISALTDLIYLILTVIIGVVLYKAHKRLCEKDERGKNKYYHLEEAATTPMLWLSIIWMVFFIISIFSIGDMVSGFFNPEYWALEQVLSFIN